MSRSVVYEIISASPQNLESSYCGKRGKSEFWDYIFQKDLQRLIWQFNSKNEYFTLDKLYRGVKKTFEYFEGGRTTNHESNGLKTQMRQRAKNYV